MATIFLSYRRTDSPQACRVYDWLVQRFGNDAVFMDVAAIPFAISFPEFIKQAIADSKILVALIGAQWTAKIHQADDPVRMEIETAIANHVPVLPVLIGNAPMPNAEELPASISTITSQNAATVGVSHDFDTHMRQLLPKIESILGMLALQSAATSDPEVILRACRGIISYLRDEFYKLNVLPGVEWRITDADTLRVGGANVSLTLHRVARLAELLELHFILSCWGNSPDDEHLLAGWIMYQLERTPLIPEEFFAPDTIGRECHLKIRRSDEDARQVWKMITSDPLRLSLAYIATVSPKNR